MAEDATLHSSKSEEGRRAGKLSIVLAAQMKPLFLSGIEKRKYPLLWSFSLLLPVPTHTESQKTKKQQSLIVFLYMRVTEFF